MTSAALARDVRVGGRWSRSQRWKNAAIWVAVRLALVVADCVPPRLLVGIGRLLGAAVGIGTLRARHARSALIRAGENLALSLLLRREKLCALDLLEVPPEAASLLAAALAEGRGAIVVSAHLGPFEVLAAAVAELGHRPAVVVRESYDPRLDQLVDAHRVRRGVTVIHRGRANAGVVMLRALRRGQPLGLLPDLPSRVRRLPVRLLGRIAELASGPARLAKLTGAPLLVATLVRPEGSGRHRLRVRRLAAGASDHDAVLTQRIADELSAAISQSPLEWLGFAGVGRSLEPEAKYR